MIILQLIKFM